MENSNDDFITSLDCDGGGGLWQLFGYLLRVAAGGLLITGGLRFDIRPTL